MNQCMMKKLTFVALLFCVVILVSACGKKKEEIAAENLNLEHIYQNLMESQENEEKLVLFEGMGEDVDFYSGLSEIDLKQKVFYIAPIAGFACEVMLVEVSDKNDVETVKKIFEDRVAYGASDTGYPETAALWAKNAKVQTSGNYVGMIVFPDGYSIPENVFLQNYEDN